MSSSSALPVAEPIVATQRTTIPTCARQLSAEAEDAREQLVRAFPHRVLEIKERPAHPKDGPRVVEVGYSERSHGLAGDVVWVPLGSGDTLDEAVQQAAQGLQPKVVEADLDPCAIWEAVPNDLRQLVEVCAAAVCTHCAGTDTQVEVGAIARKPEVAPGGDVYWHRLNADGSFARICLASLMRRRADEWLAERRVA